MTQLSVASEIESRYSIPSDSPMQRSNFVILSGCSGGGKSTILSELAKRGYAHVPEPGRQIVIIDAIDLDDKNNLNYDIRIVPQDTVQKRADFILQELTKQQKK